MRTARLTLSIAALATAALVVSACSASSSKSTSTYTTNPKKPNIVFVLTDDLSWNLVSHMPHVQALQKQGQTMSKYYVVDSLCCPSRSAIFTGEYPHDDGVFTNKGSDGGYEAYNKNGDPQKAFAPALQQAGYRTGFMGKYLNGYQPSDKPAPGWNEWDVAGNGYPEYNYTLNENGKQQKYGNTSKDYLVDVLSGKGGQFIDSSASAHKPFMLEVATFAPHAPYTPPKRYLDKFPNLTYPRTAAYDKLPTNAPTWLKSRPPLPATEQTQINTIYQKRVEADLAVDDMIGHLEARLQATHQLSNTYFVFSSDNGYHMGDYRLYPGKQTAYETDVHVPLIVAGPHVPAGKTDSQLATNIDIAPTFDSLTGATANSHIDGVSMAGLWHGQQPSNWQNAILVEHHGPDNSAGDPDRQGAKKANPPSYEAIRTATALYVKYTSTGEQEYYNTAQDPYELANIASKGVPPAFPKELAALSSCHGATQCQAAAHVP
ncbi:MAG: sulfatase family protein [Jatrophihabitans sp.]